MLKNWRKSMLENYRLILREYESFSVNSYQAVGLLW